MQPVPAGPAPDRQQLVEVAALAGAAHRLRMHAQQVTLDAQRAAVELPAHAQQERGVEVAPRAQHLQQHLRSPGHHHEARAGGRQRQRAAAPRIADRELLSSRPAPRDAEHVGALDLQVVEQPRGQSRQVVQAVRQMRRRRFADARRVERHHAGALEVRHERCHRLDVGADAVEQQQRAHGVGAAADRVADALVAQGGATDAQIAPGIVGRVLRQAPPRSGPAPHRATGGGSTRPASAHA